MHLWTWSLQRFLLGVLFVFLTILTACSKRSAVFTQVPSPQPEQAVFNGDGKPVAAKAAMPVTEQKQLLQEHNRVRSTVGVEPLTWSGELAEYAQRWADYLANNDCKLMHRPKQGHWRGLYGENLFAGTAGRYGVVDAVRAWEREKRFFQGEALAPSNVQLVGHYTQLVWRDTRQIGCGLAQCQGMVIVVCNYDPPGNMLHETPY